MLKVTQLAIDKFNEYLKDKKAKPIRIYLNVDA